MPSPVPAAATRSRLPDRVFAALIALYALVHAVLVCARRPFWMDELVTWLLSTDRSLPHALTALGNGADGGGPLPFVLAWTAGRLGASGELGFRLLSCAYVAVGLIALGRTLRDAFGTGPARLAVGWTLCGCTLVLYQNSEFRFYALLLGLSALAIHRYARYFAGDRGNLWTYGGLHALLALTHPFGLLYSGALAAAALAGGWLARVRSWPLALAGAAGAAAGFGPWLPAFLRQTKVLVADSQLPRPGVADLLRVYGQVAPTVYYDQETKELPLRLLHAHPVATLVGAGLALGAAGGCLVLAFRRVAGEVAHRPPERPGAAGARVALLTLAGVFVLAPAAGWVLARVGRPVFLHRYFIPSVAGFTILYAAGFDWLRRRFAGRGGAGGTWGRAGLAGLGGLFAAWPLVSAVRLPDDYAALRTRLAGLEAGEYAGLPVACISPPEYWPLAHYAGGSADRFWLVLDRELAFTPGSGAAATEFNFSRVQAGYYPKPRVTTTAEFLRDHPRFLLDDERTPWFERRIRAAPERFRVERPAGLPAHAVLVGTTDRAGAGPPPE